MILIADQPTRRRPSDIVDEHYYTNPEFFMQQADRYDNYDRNGPKIYVGEYAVTQGCGQGNLRGAIGEAAFMTGMERNSDVVVMASYAPLFVNVNHKRWNPDLINFDSSRVYGMPSYYVQKMFAENRGDVVLPIAVSSPGWSRALPRAPQRRRDRRRHLAHAGRVQGHQGHQGDKTLFACDFADGTKGWRLLGGDWKAADGVLRQNSSAENVRAVAGDKSWTDYTYSLKARKLGGAEGFLILFSVRDDNRKCWWNLGGWGNQRHAIEMGGIVGNSVPGTIETGRWYDIRIELGQEHQVLPRRQAHPRRHAAGAEVALRLGQPRQGHRRGHPESREHGQLGTVHGYQAQWRQDRPRSGPGHRADLRERDGRELADGADEGRPGDEDINVKGPSFQHAFPGNSVTILRLKVQ